MLTLGLLYARLIKQSTLVTDDLRLVLNSVFLFVVTLQKYSDLADLDRLFLTICAMPASARNISLSISRCPEIKGQRWLVKSQ